MPVREAPGTTSTMENGIITISNNCISIPYKRKSSVPCLKTPSTTLPQRKTSLPVAPLTPISAIKLKKSTGKISCVTSFAGGYKKRAPELKKANLYMVPDPCTESTVGLISPHLETANLSTEGPCEVTQTAACFKPTSQKYIPKPKPATHNAELRRCSMSEPWGLQLVYRMSHEGGLCLGVLTAGHKAKLQPGDHVITINGWQIQAMDQPQVAANLFRAAGFSVVLRFQKTNLTLDGWDILGDF